ncbi:MAG TPA: hypothetical protein VLH86_01415 [Patescibacteria group bacterium]|nr:hypothetical protein [Patescibacteria group bacterium]
MSEDSEQQAPSAGWQYKPGDSPPVAGDTSPLKKPPVAPAEPDITWTASEYIAHNKSAGWYAGVIGGAVLFAAIVFLLTHDKISTVTVVVVALLFTVAAARKPRVITYALGRDGITIGANLHSFGEYRAFTVRREGVFANIELLPLKRFMPMTSIYCSPDNEDDILTLLSQHVPYEQPNNSLAENFARRIRF